MWGIHWPTHFWMCRVSDAQVNNGPIEPAGIVCSNYDSTQRKSDIRHLRRTGADAQMWTG